MAAIAPAAAPAPARSPFSSRTRWPLRPLLAIAHLSPPSPPFNTSLCLRCSPLAGHLHHLTARRARCGGSRPAAFAVRPAAAEDASEPSERWLLEPVGDGDCRHIGFRVQMPSAFEMASDVVTAGRLPDKADMVIPIATVSGLHARLEKKEGTLSVTDMDSTNGTYVDGKKLRPGLVAMVSPGSCITFGDTHLAMFRVLKLQDENLSGDPAKSVIKTESEVPQIETTS